MGQFDGSEIISMALVLAVLVVWTSVSRDAQTERPVLLGWTTGGGGLCWVPSQVHLVSRYECGMLDSVDHISSHAKHVRFAQWPQGSSPSLPGRSLWGEMGQWSRRGKNGGLGKRRIGWGLKDGQLVSGMDFCLVTGRDMESKLRVQEKELNLLVDRAETGEYRGPFFVVAFPAELP